MILLKIENIILLFFVLEATFKIHLTQKSEGARALTLDGHDASLSLSLSLCVCVCVCVYM